jgi:SAM-dependent methyltransferase
MAMLEAAFETGPRAALSSVTTYRGWSPQAYFREPLRAIEHPSAGSTPIWGAASFDPDNLVGISERFLEKADVYTATYTHCENILDLLRRAIAVHEIPLERIHTVLDFGSGPGTNTIFPLHLIKPSLSIVATDISLPLLATLSRLLDEHPFRAHVDIVAWDCMSGGLTPGSFDLVTGVSLLHHLMDPRDAFRSAYEALRPGGYAIFVDPFDGAGLVRGLYEVLLSADVGRNDRLRAETVHALNLLSADYEARLAGSEPEHFTLLEDKWIFSQEWIVENATAIGFRLAKVRGNQDHLGMYGEYVRTQLRICGGEPAADLPQWANGILDAFDGSLTPAARRRMILEGTIVLQK